MYFRLASKLLSSPDWPWAQNPFSCISSTEMIELHLQAWYFLCFELSHISPSNLKVLKFQKSIFILTAHMLPGSLLFCLMLLFLFLPLYFSLNFRLQFPLSYIDFYHPLEDYYLSLKHQCNILETSGSPECRAETRGYNSIIVTGFATEARACYCR